MFKQAAWKHYISPPIMKSKRSQEKEEQETGRNSGWSAIKGQSEAEQNARAGPFKINLQQRLVQCDEEKKSSDEPERNEPSPYLMLTVQLSWTNIYYCWLSSVVGLLCGKLNTSGKAISFLLERIKERALDWVGWANEKVLTLLLPHFGLFLWN